MPTDRSRGFTLIELLIVMVIITILAAVAMPSYLDSVRQSRRADAMTTLLRVQLEEEKYRANNTSYGTLAQLGLSATSPDGYYTISISDNTATAFTATATAVSGKSQAADSGCTSMVLTQSGADTSYTPAACWRK